MIKIPWVQFIELWYIYEHFGQRYGLSETFSPTKWFHPMHLACAQESQIASRSHPIHGLFLRTVRSLYFARQTKQISNEVLDFLWVAKKFINDCVCACMLWAILCCNWLAQWCGCLWMGGWVDLWMCGWVDLWVGGDIWGWLGGQICRWLGGDICGWLGVGGWWMHQLMVWWVHLCWLWYVDVWREISFVSQWYGVHSLDFQLS